MTRAAGAVRAPGSTVGQALRDAGARLKAAGCDTPRLDARVLLGHVLGTDPARLPLRLDETLDPAAAARFEALADRRATREPVAHLTGAKDFWEHTFAVTADVLTPRPESETLVEAALDFLAPDRPARVLDLGTGSGCLLLSVLAARPEASGVGLDSSAAALAVASANAAALGLSGRCTFVEGDFAQAPRGPFDAVLANPPYIPTGDIPGLAPELAFEPPAALNGGRDGLDAYRALAPLLAARMTAGARLFLEVGQGQADAVPALLEDHGLKCLGSLDDLGGTPRCVVAERP